MFSWRARRQIVVLLIMVAPLVIAGLFLVPVFIPEASCSDNKKNQGELEVDCGGPCVPCELKNPRAVEIFWARAVPVRENIYDVAAFIHNPNIVLASDKVIYEFNLFDEFGLVASVKGKTFIVAQERTHIIEANAVTSRQPTRVEFRVKEVKWQLKETPLPNIIVERRDYKVMENQGIKQSLVEASIQNRANLDFSKVEVNFLVFDKDGNLVGANKTVVDNLAAGSRKTVKSLWPGLLRGEAATVEIEPRVNIFDPGAILKPQ